MCFKGFPLSPLWAQEPDHCILHMVLQIICYGVFEENLSGFKQFWKLEHISFELWHPEACFQYWTIYVQSKGAKLSNCKFLICNFQFWKLCWFLSSKKWNLCTNNGASRSKWQIFSIMKILLFCHSKIYQPDIITIRILLWLSDKQQKRK